MEDWNEFVFYIFFYFNKNINIFSCRAKSNEWSRDEEKGTKGPDPFEVPAKGIRRLSIAAMNFFSPANKQKKKKKSISDVGKDPDVDRPFPIIFNKAIQKHRMSLQEENHNEINKEVSHYGSITNNL